MSPRDALARGFLGQTDWSDACIAPLAGDASNRRYLRLRKPGSADTAVLMDAPPEKGEDVRPFVAIARYLSGIGLSAPDILALDNNAGFLLLEDLGDDLFARVIPHAPELEAPLYRAATDLLAELHAQPAPAGLAKYSPPMMADMAALAFDWYREAIQDADLNARAEFHVKLRMALSEHASETGVLIQRDYHAENLLWLPDRIGTARVGRLNFQDAMLGHPAYDLVSLLQDARRDVPAIIETSMIARYVRTTGMDEARFRAAYHCLGAQRNLRILGVFARLCIRDGKPHYINLIPRVWAHLMRDLDHPVLGDIAGLVRSELPEPSSQILKRLKDKCATAPTQ